MGVVIAGTDYSAYHFFEAARIENELFRVMLALIIIGINAIHAHFLLHSIGKMEIWVDNAMRSHSGACHFCNADPDHCIKICKKPLPICSRHLGYYGTLVALGLSALPLKDNWIHFVNNISWEWHLTVFFGLLVLVVAEGGLGKAKIINVNNLIRLGNGISSACGVLFFTTFILSFFHLFQ